MIPDEITRQFLANKQYPFLTLDPEGRILEADAKNVTVLVQPALEKKGFQPFLLFADISGLYLTHDSRSADIYPRK